MLNKYVYLAKRITILKKGKVGFNLGVYIVYLINELEISYKG